MAEINHMYVPKHEKLNEEDVQKLLKQFNIKLNQLPRIKIKDPAIQHLEPVEGDVIKISRKSETNGEADFYRIVVA